MANLDEPIDLADDDPIEESAPDEPIEIHAGPPPLGGSQIKTFGTKSRHEDKWDRTPNVTGPGTIHTKVFHAKLREDALEYLETQINEWLDKHPEYEVKHVTSSIGELKTKTMSEPAMFITVWV